MELIPLMVQLNNKKVIIIGGGRIADRRIHTLLPAEAAIHVISPEVTPTIHALHVEKQITWHKKKVERDDLLDAFLIITAADDVKINELAAEWAPSNALVNCSGVHEYGNVHFPSSFKRGRLQISVSTGGASPILASKIKKQLAASYDDRYEQYVDFLFEARSLIKESRLSKEKKQALLRGIVEEDYFESEKQRNFIFHLKNDLSLS
ncbi:NAD(P)-binding protein [Halobacillus massiliensis]|uniref:NAD(P)-binding protein n=1 Tax=Halobacillus massiliensis TaxID=1926286 RepID=UPI0009E1F239|nr:NAD(P)-binding protein [Halobacillus massiliensis]